MDFADPELKSEAVGGIASRISAYPLVRQALVERQRAFAGQEGGAVLDGRDIGTIIAPEADAKLFVTATPEVRARRRFDELLRMGLHVEYDEVLLDIRARDERDAAARRRRSGRPRTRCCSTPASSDSTAPSLRPSPRSSGGWRDADRPPSSRPGSEAAADSAAPPARPRRWRAVRSWPLSNAGEG
jgi:hypothetical protein